MQAQLGNLLDLHRTKSRVSIDSITSFAGSTNTKRAFKKFCQNLYQIGVRGAMIREKESEIVKIFKAQNTAISGQIDNSDLAGPSRPRNAAIGSQIDDGNIAGPSKPQNAAISGQIDDSNIADRSQLPVVSDLSGVEFC